MASEESGWCCASRLTGPHTLEFLQFRLEREPEAQQHRARELVFAQRTDGLEAAREVLWPWPPRAVYWKAARSAWRSQTGSGGGGQEAMPL